MEYKGYKPSEHKPEHPVFSIELGGVAPNPSGNWQPYIPPTDVQQNLGIESEACTCYATLDAVEMLANFLYKDTRVWSKRYLAWAAGITHTGGDPWTVGTVLEQKGTVLDSAWPQTAKMTTWEELYATPPQTVQTAALEWTAQYNLSKEWVNPDPASLMAALKYSPISVAGFAWVKNTAGLYYSPKGTQPCHDFVLIGYVENKHWVVFDSYEKDIKLLAWDFTFTDCIKYNLTKNTVNTAAGQSSWESFIMWMQKILGVGYYSAERLGGKERSPEWPKVRAQYLKLHPKCELCGGTKRLTVHHRIPFHIDPTRELDLTNLATLCEGNKTINCHLRFGHFDNFRTKWNIDLQNDIDKWNKRFLAKTEADI